MLPIISQIANEYKANLQNLYGDELAELILFGSHARGTNHEEVRYRFCNCFSKCICASFCRNCKDFCYQFKDIFEVRSYAFLFAYFPSQKAEFYEGYLSRNSKRRHCDMTRYEESIKAMKKADDALESAKHNLKGKFFTATANRTYYACCYCIIAFHISWCYFNF
jgi:hypothetical protein